MSALEAHHLLIRTILVFAFTTSGSFIVVPQNFVEVSQRETALGDRGLLVEGVADYLVEYERFFKSLPCLKSFLQTFIEYQGHCVFVAVSNGQYTSEIADIFLKSLGDDFAFFAHTVNVDFEIAQLVSSAIILMETATSLEDGFYILEPCDRGCSYAVVLTDEFEDEESFLEQTKILSRSMWNRRLGSVAMLARVQDSVVVAGSTTFQPDEPCTPSSPIILDKCNEDAWNDYKGIRSPDLNGCALRIAYFEAPPYVMTSNDSTRLLGFEGSLTEEIMQDQSILRHKVLWDDNTSYAEQAHALIFNDVMADLVIGGILQQSGEDIDFSTQYDTLQLVWVVPKTPNISLKGLVEPFHVYVWAAVGGCLLVGGLIRAFLIKDVSWLDIFALIIGVSVARRPTRPPSKIIFISWSIFGLFLTQLYVDSLADQLINAADVQLKTIDDLISSSFQIGGTAAFANLFNEFKKTEEIFVKISEKFVKFDQDQYHAQFVDLLDGRNGSFALVAVLNSSRSNAIQTPHAYTLTSDIICSFPLALATWKGFPFLTVINQRIHDYIDVGILDHLISVAIQKGTRKRMFAMVADEEYKSQLHLLEFVPPFLLLTMGFVGGLILLVLEIALYPWKLLE